METIDKSEFDGLVSTRRLSPRERRFIREYCIDLDPEAASLRSGFGPSTGKELLRDTFIAEAVDNAVKMQEKRFELNQDWVVFNLMDIHDEAKKLAAGRGLSTRLKAIETSAKILGMFSENVNVNVTKKHDINQLTDAELDIIIRSGSGQKPPLGEIESH